MKRSVLAGASALALLVCGAAQAQTVTGLYNTGVDDAGTPRPGSLNVETHYAITASVIPADVGQQPFITNCCSYIESGNSHWIVPNGNLGQSSIGDTTYTLTFNLAGFDLSTVQLSGMFAADNSADIVLNGVDTGKVADGFTAFTSFALGSGFVSGDNTLAFVVTNTGGPEGLNVASLSLTGQAPSVTPAVPEPATWALMLLGFGALGARLRSRRPAAQPA